MEPLLEVAVPARLTRLPQGSTGCPHRKGNDQFLSDQAREHPLNSSSHRGAIGMEFAEQTGFNCGSIRGRIDQLPNPRARTVQFVDSICAGMNDDSLVPHPLGNNLSTDAIPPA